MTKDDIIKVQELRVTGVTYTTTGTTIEVEEWEAQEHKAEAARQANEYNKICGHLFRAKSWQDFIHRLCKNWCVRVTVEDKDAKNDYSKKETYYWRDIIVNGYIDVRPGDKVSLTLKVLPGE